MGKCRQFRKAADHADFKGTALFVETHDFVRKPEDSPNPGHCHHEVGNAESYFLVGDALGKAMFQILAAAPPKNPVEQPLVCVRFDFWPGILGL